MSEGVLTTSGSSLASQVLSTQQQVSVLKKQQDVAKLEGEAQLKLLESVPTSTARPDPSSPIGYNINVKA